MAERFAYFDLGKVLVDFDHQFAVDNVAQLSACSPERVREVVFESGLQDRYETGLVECEQFAEEINQALDSALSVAEVMESVSAIFSLNEPILRALNQMRLAEVPMGVLSNTCEAHWQWIVRQKWQIPGDWFRETVLSYEVQSMKPDSKIYEVCERRSGCDPAAIFFTDDREENVEAAHRRGWTTHLFQDVEQLCKAIDLWIAST